MLLLFQRFVLTQGNFSVTTSRVLGNLWCVMAHQTALAARMKQIVPWQT